MSLIQVVLFAPHGPASDKLSSQPRVVAPASTVLFVPKNATPANSEEFQSIAESNIPADAHYVDLTKPDTIVIMSQPKCQSCAVLGGIMALRMKTLGGQGVVAGGRVRDLTELRSLDFPVDTNPRLDCVKVDNLGTV